MERPHILQVAVFEDVPEEAALLMRHIAQSGVQAVCESFDSAETLLGSFRAEKYDLVFLDIYMGGIEVGVRTARAIREMDQNVTLAFTTSSDGHTLESYRLGALKYLEKPVKAEDVKDTLTLALARRKERASVSITAEGGAQMELPLDSILYFEQQGHVVTVHTTSGVMTTSQSVRMDELENRLPNPPFTRCHRSFLVNLDYALKADKEIHAFRMKNGERVDIKRGQFTTCEQARMLRAMENTGRDRI